MKTLVRADSFQWHFIADPANDFSMKTLLGTHFPCSYEIWGEHIMDRGWIFRKKQRSAWIGYITGNHKAKWQNRAKLQNRSRCDLRKVVSGSNIWVVEKMGQPIARAPCNYNHTSEQWMTTLEVEAGCNLTRRKVWVNKLGCQALDITINWC